MLQGQCFSCQAPLQFVNPPGFREECPKCKNDVRCCRNCQFYDKKAYNECKETQAEVIREKDRSNRCDYFLLRPPESKQNVQPDLRAAAEALFKKK